MIYKPPDRRFPRRAKPKREKMKKFSVILLAALAPGGADAAKMCVIDKNIMTSYAYNSSSWTWAVGTGCAGTNDESAATTGNVACGGTYISGIASCSDKLNQTTGGWGAYSPPAAGLDGVAANARNCYCKMMYPKEGIWYYLFYNSTGGCASGCAIHCAWGARFKPSILSQILALPY
jgi:hypothetical protein